MTQQSMDDMVSMKTTFTSVMASLEERMASFEAELQKSTKNPHNAPSLAGLTADFTTFRSFVVDTMVAFRRQMELLSREVDTIEMRSRRKMLLVHGVAEQKDEDTSLIVVDVVKNLLQLKDFTSEDIRRCHRMGRSSGVHKPRPILVKFDQVMMRDKIWFTKTKLKGSGKTISEFLTKTRHEIFMAARERFGVSKAWTREGHIFVLDSDGSQRRIASIAELTQLKSIISSAKPAIPRARRAAIKK